MMASHLAGGKVSIASTCWIPALLTSMSTLPKVLRRGFDHSGYVAGHRHVGGRIDGLHAKRLLDVLANSVDFGGIAEAIEHYVGARRRQGLGNT